MSPAPSGDSPCPGRSIARIGPDKDSSAIKGRQLPSSLPKPWIRTSGGPLPGLSQVTLSVPVANRAGRSSAP